MTAEPIHDSPWSSMPEWMIPPVDGFTTEDFLALPDLPPHTELIDGSLVFVSPQREFHGLAMYVLEKGLRKTAPPELRVRRETCVVVGRQDCPEPDVLVLKAGAIDSMTQTSYPVADVLLAVEVVSPSSQGRDRERKPVLYAKAGIQHFWRVELENARLVVYVYELDKATGMYGLVGIQHDRLKLSSPFDIDVDLTELDRV